MQARFYHPGFGRFTAPDPARDQHFEDTQSWNIYSYVRNSPIMSTDPTGMVEEDKKNATETKGPQGGMSGTDDYSRLWQNDWNKWAQTGVSFSPTLFAGKNFTFISPELLASVTTKSPDLSLNALPGFDANIKITFSQSSGNYSMEAKIGGTQVISLIGTGWSGNGEGKNNPSMQGVREKGPLPQGDYRIGNPGTASTGPYSMRLNPTPTTNMLTRDKNSFLIHGPAGPGADHPYGQESLGCPILAPVPRHVIGRSGVRHFEVTP